MWAYVDYAFDYKYIDNNLYIQVDIPEQKVCHIISIFSSVLCVTQIRSIFVHSCMTQARYAVKSFHNTFCLSFIYFR